MEIMPLAIVRQVAWRPVLLVLASVLYLLSMGLLFWRYRVATRQLSEKLRQCREQEARTVAASDLPNPEDETQGQT